MGAWENKFQISQELRKHTQKLSLFCEIWGFWSLFSLASIRTFSLELFHTTYYIYSPWKVWKRMPCAWNYSGFKLLNFLMDFYGSQVPTSKHPLQCLLTFFLLKKLCHEIHQNSNSGKGHHTEWNIKNCSKHCKKV